MLLREEFAERLVSWSGLGEAFLWTRRSPAKSTVNEDAVIAHRIDERRAVLAVADGAGGHRSGDVASEIAVECVRAAAEKVANEASDDLTGAFIAAFDDAQANIRARAAGAATTLLVLLIDGTDVRVLHVGDSKALVIGGRGAIRLETIPHSPVGYGVEAGFIGTDEVVGHEDLHIVSNLVGTDDMHVGVSSPVELRPLDRVLLASDGLYDNVSVEEIVHVLRRGAASESVRTIAQRCSEEMERDGHPDDLTLVVFRPQRGAASK